MNGSTRFVLHFLVIAPLKHLFSGRWMQKRETDWRKRIPGRVEQQVYEDQERLAVRYGPLGWGAMGQCPHRSGHRFYVTPQRAIVRIAPTPDGGRTITRLAPDGRITSYHHMPTPSLASLALVAAESEWRRVA